MFLVELKHHEKIPFTWRSERYGRAEFQICTVYKRGKIKDIYIQPHQQPDKKDFMYHFSPSYSTGLSFGSFGRIDEPEIWDTAWCKEHKTITMMLYVPCDSKHFYISDLSTTGLFFCDE